MTGTDVAAQQLLSQVEVFAGLSKRQLKKVVASAREVDHEAGRVITSEGKGALGFHLILSGDATVSVGATEIRQLHKGDYFGEMSMIDGKPRSATVSTTTPLRALVVSPQLFDKLLEEEPDFARGLLRLLCARLREAEART